MPAPTTGAPSADAPAPAATEAPAPLHTGVHAAVHEVLTTAAASTPDTTPAPTVVAPVLAAPTPVTGATAAVATPAAAPVPQPAHTQVLTAVGPLLTGADGSHELTIRLDPDGLGAVHVRLSVSGDEVRMHLTAAETGTRDALRDGLTELKARLEESGLRATSLDVGSGSTPGRNGADAQDLRQPRPSGHATVRHGPAPPLAAPTPAPLQHTDSRLDLRM